MRIDITDLVKKTGKEEHYSVESALKSIKSGESYPIRKIEPFTLTVNNVAGNRLLCTGKTKATLEMRCDRCLTAVEQVVPVRIERTYPIKDGAVTQDEEDPVSGIVEDAIDTDILIEDEIRIGLPVKVLCQPDCKGLCPVCGNNLNEGECGCERTVGSLQMAKALEGIFDELKEV